MAFMFVCANLVITCMYVVFFSHFRDKPEHPPSAAATQPTPHLNIAQSFHELKDNSNFIVIAFYYMFMFGAYCTFGNLQSEIFKPFGLQIYEIALLSCISLFFGIFSALSTGKFLDFTRKYKFVMQLIPFLVVINMLFFLFFALPRAQQNDKTLLYFNGIFFGAAMLPVIPLCMAFSVEVTFPLAPSTSNSLVQLMGQTGTFIFSIIGTEMTMQDFKEHIPEENRLQDERYECKLLIMMLTLVCFVAWLLSFLVTEDLRRTRIADNKPN